jgi:hypothetical protein
LSPTRWLASTFAWFRKCQTVGNITRAGALSY